MGQNVSVDTAPLPLHELFVDSSKLKLRNLQNRQPTTSKFRSNIKAWSFQPHREDSTETEIFPVDFTAEDFTSFDSKKCYIVLHLFRKNGFDASTVSDKGTGSSRRAQSLFRLAISASEQLSPRGVEHKFSTNDLQSVFFKNSMIRHKTPFSTANAFGKDDSDEREDYMNDEGDNNSLSVQIGYDLYLWHGKNSAPSTQAFTVTRGYELERRLLEPYVPQRFFDIGIPAPMSQFFYDDVPPVRSKSAQLQNTPSSSVALFMSLYQHCHLFRNLANSAEDASNDFDSDIAFRSLLQLPPDNTNSSFGQMEDDDEDMEMQASPVNSPRTDENKPKYDRSTSFSPTLPANFKISKLPNLNISSLGGTTTLTSPRKRPAPEGTKTSDSKRHIRTMSSQDSYRSGSSYSTLSSDRDRLRVNLGSVEQTERNDPSPTPRRMNLNQYHLTPDSGRAMSGSELVVYYRKICSQIYDYVFLGSDLVARNKDLLQTNGITHIVNAAKVVCDVYFPTDFSYHVLNLYDAGNESVIGVFFGVIDFIEKAKATGGKVYIHCYEGVSRSTTLTIAYLMWKLRQKFNHVMEDVKKRRPVASPNPGFIVQLLQWEKMLLDPQTYLYRISPQNDKYAEHKHVVPKLCYTNHLDSRTCFILHSSPNKVIFLWIGNNSNKLSVEANKFVQQLKKYIADNDTRIEVINEGQSNSQFESLMSLVRIEPKIDSTNPYPDLDFLESDFLPPASDKKMDEEEDEEEEEDDLEYADLYVYPDFEPLDGFDSEDLLEDSAYVLQPQAEQDVIYVWVGEEFAREKNMSMKSAGQLVADQFLTKKNLSKDSVQVTIVEQDEEPEDFWTFFING